MRRLLTVSFCLVLLAQTVFADTGLVHHDLMAKIDPEKNTLSVSDVISVPESLRHRDLYFLLSSDLTATSPTPGVSLEIASGSIEARQFGMVDEDFAALASGVSLRKHILHIPEALATFTLEWNGRINHGILQQEKEYARGFSETSGIISSAGVYLAGSSRWIPWFNDGLITFSLTTSLPATWDSVSQGTRTDHRLEQGRWVTRWEATDPMEQIYLIAAPFTEYSRKCGDVDMMAFLRKPEETLATTYLETTGQYLEMYKKLIGPFPFSKFALVENFWETGYGMPSFTLLGEKIIRFPFILHSSYPHELLHNWWGNGVYVKSGSGNWSEGITAYLADHLIKEQQGQGQEYRQTLLQKYSDYVKPSGDFPLKSFRSRFDAASEAIGYGKAAMMWEMLREQVGDDDFIKSWQSFFRKNRFQTATFDDIRNSFSEVTGKDLGAFFRQWVDRVGAPDLRLSGVTLKTTNDGTHLAFTISQAQKEEPFDLDIPVEVFLEKDVIESKVHLGGREQSYDLVFSDKPVALRVDPRFNVFRRLHYLETSPALSKIFGDQSPLILLPSMADETRSAA
ncbi:MAG: M1 family peptidase [Candidatus Riflebacteria bacterium]|nr:M1 family peptidase [Candidatus Riflebacteria bacterium]